MFTFRKLKFNRHTDSERGPTQVESAGDSLILLFDYEAANGLTCPFPILGACSKSYTRVFNPAFSYGRLDF